MHLQSILTRSAGTCAHSPAFAHDYFLLFFVIFLAGFWAILGEVFGGFWEVFGSFLGGVWEVFGRFLGGFSEEENTYKKFKKTYKNLLIPIKP